MNPTKTTPHVRLTVNDLKQQYLTGKLTVKGYVYNWILASRKCGWKLRTKVKDFCQELGISRSAFYKAIAELKTEPGSKFHFEVPDGEIEMWIDDSTEDASHDRGHTVHDHGHPFHDRGHPHTIVDNPSTIVDTPTTIVDTPSMNVENQTPKAAHSKASTAPSSISHLFTTYIQGEKKSLNANKQPRDLGVGGDSGSDLMRDLEPTEEEEEDPGKLTQSDPHHSHSQTMGSLGSNSMDTNGKGGDGVLSSRLRIAEFLAETKRKLQEQVEWQRRERIQRWARATDVLPVGTQGSSLTPDVSGQAMTTT